jgi:YVTN family beta-propeller protein
MAFSGPASGSFTVTSRFAGLESAGAGGAEVAAARDNALFILGPDGIDVRSTDGTLLGTIDTSAFGSANSIAVSGNLLAVAIAAANPTDPGGVLAYEVDVTGGVLTVTFVGDAEVGANPDQLTFTADGTKILVANEGEPNSYGQADSVDPEGSISIIDLVAGTVATAGFSAFNGQADALRDAGVRIFGPGATVAQDFEPEYIAISADGTRAYVTLQENNALAIVDIATATVTAVVPLGFKDHGAAALDASDRDGPGNDPAINITTHAGLFGMYQPDAIAGFTAGGQQYFVTANEGDARDYDGFEEEVRLSSLTLDGGFPGGTAIQSADAAGRLNVTNQLGDVDGDGDFDALVSFGARSLSIWDATGALVWDSGDAIEQAIAALDPDWAEPTADQRGTVEGLGDDTRSDNKGPEPEGVAIGTIDGETYAFVGLERANGIMLFRLDEAGATPAFEYQGIFHTQGDVGPEVFAVIDASISASGNTELLVANEVSGTTTLYEIAPAAVEPDFFTLQILHISDQEAGLQATSRMGNAAAIFDRLEDDASVDASITLSPGDAWIPGPFYAAEADPSMEAALEAFYGVDLPSGPQVSGRVSLAFMNAIEADAASFGNHEFDLGTNAINAIIGANGAYPGAQFPYLSANLDFSADTGAIGGNLAARVTADGQEASTIKGRIAGTAVVTQGEEKIGLVAATTQILRSISSPGAVEVIGPDANDMAALAAILQPKIDALLAQGINKIVLMSHLQQYQLEEALVPLLSGVDVVIAAGSHALFADSDDLLRPGDTPVEDYPIWTTNADGKDALIVSTPNEFAYVGRLQVQFDANGDVVKDAFDSAANGVIATTDEGVASVYGADIDQAFAAGSKGARVDALADAVQAVIGAQDGATFGWSDVFLDGKRIEVRRQETNLGNLTADANLAEAKKTDASVLVSIKNGGGIRDSIGSITGTPISVEGPTLANPDAGKEAGEVSQLDITNSLRFNNTLSLLTLSAEGLLAVLEHGVSTLGDSNTPGQFPQVSGVEFSFDRTRPAGDRIVSATIVDADGTILDVLARDGLLVGDAAREIRIVTLNFLAGGGDGYPFATLGTDRVDLVQAGVRDGVAIFADNGTEQDALAEYLAAEFPTQDAAFSQADTDVPFDTRIQQVGTRADTVEPALAFDLWRDAVFDGASPASFRQLATNLDYANAAAAGEQASSSATDSTGASLARFRAGDGDVAVREVDFGATSVGANGAMTIDWAGRDATVTLTTAWNSIKNLVLTEFTGDALTVRNVVNVVFDFGPDGNALPDLARDIVVQGAKRVDGSTGDADDTIVVEVDSNEARWGNLVRLETNAGNDSVEITASLIDWSASFSRAVYNPLWTTSEIDLGDGADTFLGGEGRDAVTGGAGDDALDGRGGLDTAVFGGARADYDLIVLDAATGLTIVTGTDGVDTLVRFEALAFDDATLTYSGGIWA